MKSHLSQQEGTKGASAISGLESIEVSSAALWSARTAASFCGFQSGVTILRAFREGRLVGYKLGCRAVRFAPQDVKAWVEAGRVSRKEGAK
jgi:hypothetical protein